MPCGEIPDGRVVIVDGHVDSAMMAAVFLRDVDEYNGDGQPFDVRQQRVRGDVRIDEAVDLVPQCLTQFVCVLRDADFPVASSVQVAECALKSSPSG